MSQSRTIDVVAIGESMVMFQPMMEGLLQYAPIFVRSLAGAESNFSIGLKRLGLKPRWISRLGMDPFGDFIISALSGEGIDTSFVIRDDSAPTAIYFKESRGIGDPSVYYYRKNSAASRLKPQDIKAEWFEGARHLHVTGITPALGPHTAEAISEAMRLARSLGLTVSFDPNLRRKLWSDEQARKTLLALIPLCDIFLPGLDEAQFLLGTLQEEKYGKAFLELGAKLVVLKLGERGSLGFFEESIVQAEPHKVSRIVDTVGAGDAFAAGLLSGLLSAENPLDREGIQQRLHSALQRANVMGAMATQFRGDWEGLPNLAELQNILNGKTDVKR